MHLSQAALSGLIKELENRVGVRLLDRTTRKVSASAVGETFAPMARRVLSSLDEALDNLTNLKELRRGLVRVAAPETLSCTLLPELIAGYNNSHPASTSASTTCRSRRCWRACRTALPTSASAGRRRARSIGRSAHDLRRPALCGVAQR
jgi:DNA-binding transcriptional LysR family regulator